MNKRHKILLTPFVLFSLCAFAQQETKQMIRSANELYKGQQYEQAESAYDKVLERDRYNTTAKFNLANTYYRRSKKDDAVKAFDFLTSDGRDTDLREKSYYNKGVVLSKQEKLEEGIEAFKNALRLNPSDTAARENLQKAMMELKKKQPPPKEDPKKKPEPKKQNQEQKQSKMNQKEADQRLQMMQQKEKQVLQRMQADKSKAAGSTAKDW